MIFHCLKHFFFFQLHSSKLKETLFWHWHRSRAGESRLRWCSREMPSHQLLPHITQTQRGAWEPTLNPRAVEVCCLWRLKHNVLKPFPVCGREPCSFQPFWKICRKWSIYIFFLVTSNFKAQFLWIYSILDYFAFAHQPPRSTCCHMTYTCLLDSLPPFPHTQIKAQMALV